MSATNVKSEGMLLLDAGHWETSPRFPGQKLERIKEPSLSGWDTDTGFPYQAGQKSTRSGLAASVPSGASQRRSWAPLPHCQLKRPSVRLTRDGGGAGRLWLKWWTVKLRGIGMTDEPAQKQTSRSTCFLLSLLMCLFMLAASDWGKTLQSYVWDAISGLSPAVAKQHLLTLCLLWQWKKLGWQLKQL